jgi:hypothetical protein
MEMRNVAELFGNQMGRCHLEGTDLRGRIILKLILKKWGARI